MRIVASAPNLLENLGLTGQPRIEPRRDMKEMLDNGATAEGPLMGYAAQGRMAPEREDLEPLASGENDPGLGAERTGASSPIDRPCN